jgi:hypothetical protein
MKRYRLGIFSIWPSPPTAIGAIYIQGNYAAQCKQRRPSILPPALAPTIPWCLALLILGVSFCAWQSRATEIFTQPLGLLEPSAASWKRTLGVS